jgi:hypothetical protein
MAAVEQFNKLRTLVQESEIDVMKGLGGNKAARVRARKKMQEIKAAAQEVRRILLEADEADGAESGESASQ